MADFELSPCPFCGGRDASMVTKLFPDEAAIEEGWSKAEFFMIACPCGATHGDHPGHAAPEIAAALWNTRSAGLLNG